MSSLPQQADLWQSTLNWQPSDRQQSQFQTLYAEILSGNQRLNLTRITEPEEFWEKHLWDSLRGIFPGEHLGIADSQTAIQAIDIGTGGGFPGLPIAIAQPNWKLTLVDSTRKKVQFVQETLLVLRMMNVRCLVDRAEALGQDPKHRERYDLALIRAVATASCCAEYVIPLLKVGGSAVLYRGQWTEEEQEDLTVALDVLGAELHHCDSFKTPLTEGQRTCLILRKTSPTPDDYPRAIGIPAQNPIG